ncbi:MAG: transglutaminase domain-containing protein [Candidatus Coproplasma sp.]
MKKRYLIIIFALITALCAAVGFAGCDWLSGLDPNHEHKPSSSWSSDSTYHWHQCVAIGCTEQLDKAEHTLEHVEAKEATCTEDGNVEYWYCTGCNKVYSDSTATTEIKSVVIKATGHNIVTKSDGETHWKECETCHTVTVAPQPHTSSTYIMNKDGHYKICSECGTKFDEGTHVEGEDCTVCGYTADYVELCASDYGYNYLGTLERGQLYQSFYRSMDEMVKDFHSNEAKDASAESVSGDTIYVAGQIDYISLGMNVYEAQSVWATYRHDHPLYYWMLGQVVFSVQSLFICVDSDYIDGSVRVLQNEAIYTAIDGYLTAVEGETSAYQKAFAFHDMIIDNIDYAYTDSGDPDTSNYAHSILGVLVGKNAVCEGYAKAFALLLNASGIDNVYVTGSSKGVGHAWNMVNLDGAWYWYDLTWDDQPSKGDGTVYDYMCQYGETFADHTVNKTGDMTNPMNFLYALPAASTVAYNTASLECGEQFTLSGITYEVSGYNEVSVASATSLTGAVVLTESVTYSERTYTLTQIETSAFKNSKITSLTIPKTINVIYNLAFSGCSGLSNVTFEDKVGWSRTSAGGTEQIAQTSLESTSDAATLLKETYKVSWVTSYEYTWVKSPSAE